MRIGLYLFSCACALLLACKVSPHETSKGATGRDGPACSSNVELCNGLDDDCDGVIDEDVEDACKFDHANGRCVSGSCVLTVCSDGYSNCDGSDANGCERRTADLTCDVCEPQCDAPDADAASHEAPDATTAPASVNDAAMPPNDSGTSKPSMDAADDGDADTADACVAQAERCDGVDNDCDGTVDESGACDACISQHISGQSAECDRCACARCPAQVTRCLAHDTSTWSMRCVDLLQCYGTSNLAGTCPHGDCYNGGNGPCTSQATTAALGAGNPTCSQDPISTPCGAAAVVRETCFLETCASVCKFGSSN